MKKNPDGLKIPIEVPALLCAWYESHARALPFREMKDPYCVWLSEIMLQQTRMETVVPYYRRFLSAFPSVRALAEADENHVLKLWEGLGYYSRARNLQKAAKIVVTEHQGIFPADPAEIQKLPGIGAYTAGAVASLCYDLPTPAVDGNVLRVAARLLKIETPVDTTPMKYAITEALRKIYPPAGAGKCGIFTQSLMELGALVCLPNTEPLCEACPLKEICRAHKSGIAAELPFLSAKHPKKEEALTVLILSAGGRVAIRKREKKGLLSSLWEFPNVKGLLPPTAFPALLAGFGLKCGKPAADLEAVHVFTHIRWRMRAWLLPCAVQNKEKTPPDFVWATLEELSRVYALPTAFRKFLKLLG